MLPALTGPSHPPAGGGEPRRLVVLLHGLGADGGDLIGLAPIFAQVLPDAEFLSPDAPFPCDMSPWGRQWFSLADREMPAMLAGARASAPILDAFLDDALARRGLADRDLALVGFSQGTMMSLHVGLRRAAPVAGILGYSGALLGPQGLEEVRARPPVLLVHGDADGVVPHTAMDMSATGLRALGVPVETMTRPGLGHAIDEEGLRRGAAFLARTLA